MGREGYPEAVARPPAETRSPPLQPVQRASLA